MIATLSFALPTGMYESFTSPRCTGPFVSTASPRFPSLTTTISPFSTLRSVSVAKRRARGQSARASVGFTASTARSSSLVSPLMGPIGVIAASICATSMRSAPPIPRISRFTSSFATVSRLGDTSVACIDALASTSTTMFRPLMSVAAARGSPSASTSSASSASCKRSDKSRFNFEKRLVASLSRRIFCQSGENGTATTRRRSFKM